MSDGDGMETAIMTQPEFENLQNYSLSNPTGCTIGRRWKMARYGAWYLCEYVESSEPDTVGILRKRIEVQESVDESAQIYPGPYRFMFGVALFGWLQWCWHGLPRRESCHRCGVSQWTHGPHSTFICSQKCSDRFGEIDF